MKLTKWVVLSLIALMFPTVHAASFDCGKASSKVEKLICTDDELSHLDEYLSVIYKKAVASSKNPTAVKEKQRKWLRVDVQGCPDRRCIKTFYEKQINELSKVAVISNAKARAVCQEVAKMADSGTLAKQFIVLAAPSQKDKSRYQHLIDSTYALVGIAHMDLFHDGQIEDVGHIQGGGTCVSDTIINLTERAAVVKGVVSSHQENDVEDEYLRWASWGNSDNFLFVLGEPVIVVGTFDIHPANVNLVSSFRDGSPICALERAQSAPAIVVRSNNSALCNAVANGSVKFNPWTRNETPETGEMPLLYQVVDLEISGTPKIIAIDGEDSGAGCGSTTRWLTEMTGNRKAIADTAFGQLLGNFTGPLYPQADADIKIFSFASQPYILAKGQNTSLAVYSVWHSELKTWCELDHLPHYSIPKWYK